MLLLWYVSNLLLIFSNIEQLLIVINLSERAEPAAACRHLNKHWLLHAMSKLKPWDCSIELISKIQQPNLSYTIDCMMFLR